MEGREFAKLPSESLTKPVVKAIAMLAKSFHGSAKDASAILTKDLIDKIDDAPLLLRNMLNWISEDGLKGKISANTAIRIMKEYKQHESNKRQKVISLMAKDDLKQFAARDDLSEEMQKAIETRRKFTLQPS